MLRTKHWERDFAEAGYCPQTPAPPPSQRRGVRARERGSQLRNLKRHASPAMKSSWATQVQCTRTSSRYLSVPDWKVILFDNIVNLEEVNVPREDIIIIIILSSSSLSTLRKSASQEEISSVLFSLFSSSSGSGGSSWENMTCTFKVVLIVFRVWGVMGRKYNMYFSICVCEIWVKR